MKNRKKTFRISYILFLVSTFAFLSATSYKLSAVHAQTATPKVTVAPSKNEVPKDSADLEKIQKIKDIVASKVAELNLVEKRGIIGTIREITGMKITVTDVKGNTRQIDVDELTKFNLSSKTTSGISDLVKGTTYSFIGLHNKDTQRLLARKVGTTSTIPVFFEGAIKELNEDDFQITIVNEKGESRKVDIQSSTKTSLAATDGDLAKSGFSKLEVNQRVLAIGFPDKKDKDLVSATRLIHFEDVPPSKEMQSHVKKQ